MLYLLILFILLTVFFYSQNVKLRNYINYLERENVELEIENEALQEELNKPF